MITKDFKDISKGDVDICGGKGASLGEMAISDMPIPPGFVILTNVFDEFLEKNKLDKKIDKILSSLNSDNTEEIDVASKKIRNLIQEIDISNDVQMHIKKEFAKLKSRFVAVRSSATAEDSSTASWAGELESYLNVDKNILISSIKECWSSLFTPRAINYRIEKKLSNQKVSVAVVVQSMIQSEVSGVAFTVHPVTEDSNQLLIEAGYGLGEGIVGGIVTPDNYVLDKKNNIILDKYISEQTTKIIKDKNGINEVPVPEKQQSQQKLSDEAILALAKICLKIEKHYKKPQDIEWALCDGNLYITQSRPITTL